MSLSKSIDPLVEKIEKLSKPVRIVICVVTLILIAAPFVYFSYLPQYNDINKLTTELKKMQAELKEAIRKAKELDKFKKQMKDVEVQFNIAKKALPESDEIPGLLTNISHAGQDADMEFLLFRPETKKKVKKKKKKKGTEEKPSFYTDIPISVEVLGNYHNAILFFDKVSRLNRIVNIRNISIAPSGGKGKKKEGTQKNELKVSCMAVTYKFVETPPKASSSDEKKEKKKKK
ncbi:type 4a pilus biogenesis protein PilO [Desulfonema magnum]|uniref:Pilus assembly protein PilO domain-containing protein n=1 Tax=Desulfonema magnum TaxID=45655 RepID=A0A975BN92_9BACT|nr:type 4a pilus biogenesis protein PilO [Desulfonema magnum]QTA88596.1 Putative pilus assembly protein PilO domain-containing protein [Desulfonema magnum]